MTGHHNFPPFLAREYPGPGPEERKLSSRLHFAIFVAGPRPSLPSVSRSLTA